jgi:microcin C transport system substrate-binding protein
MVPGRYIEYERVPDYWGRDLPVNRGRWNFDLLGHDYFRDDNVMRESVKAGAVDWQVENVSKHWAQSYDFPALRNGLFVKDLIPYTPPMGLTVAFAFNLRLAKFQDIRVREALWRLRDFEWSNRVLFHGFYTRSHSFFTNTLNAARGLPSAAELELLEQFREKIPERVFTTSPQMPMTSGYGPNRRQLMMADELLQEAGWIVVDGRRVHADTGEVFSIDFLFNAPSDARVAMPYFEVLRRLGFVVTGVTAEVSRYRAQMHAFDYEATVRSIGNGHTPGPELRSKFGSAAADIEASENWIGIKDEAVDYLIEKVVNARTQEEMTAAGRALDRVLVWSFYAIPGFRAPGARFVYWNKFGHPDIVGAYRINFPDAWWYDEDKAMLVDAGTTALSRQEGE